MGTTASGKKKVILTNTGTSSLTITNIAATGDFALVAVKQTKKVTPCVNGSVVAAGGTCEIKVSFTPTQWVSAPVRLLSRTMLLTVRRV